MSRALMALPAKLRASLAVMLQYRGEIVLWAVWGVVYPAVAMAMWGAAVQARPGGEAIGGYGPHEFAAYFLLTMMVGHICTAWDVYELGYLVRIGVMSARLLRPIMPVWQSVSDNLAYKLLTLVILVPIWLVMAWLTQPAFSATRAQVALSIPAVLLAAVLNFLWCYNLGLLAFWITRMDAIGELWFGAGLFFGGRLAPITILPGPVQHVASALPFKWITWFPSASLMGQVKVHTMIGGLINQGCWLAAGAVVFWLLWRAGVKRYSAVGA